MQLFDHGNDNDNDDNNEINNDEIDEINRLCNSFYKNACDWKDTARRSPEKEPLFLAAYDADIRARNYAQVLSKYHYDMNMRQNFLALSYYYYFEALSCYTSFLKRKDVDNEIKILKMMSEKLKKGIDALSKCNDQIFISKNIDAWKLLLFSNEADLFAVNAEKLKNEGKFLDAADYYSKAVKKGENALEFCKQVSDSEVSSIDVAMERLIESNIIASDCNATIMKFYFHGENGHICEAAGELLKVIEKSNNLCSVNPEWSPHFTKKEQFIRLGIDFLSAHKETWKDLLWKYSDKELRRLMEKIDPILYKEIEREIGVGVIIMENNTLNQTFNGPVGIGNLTDNAQVGNVNMHFDNNYTNESIKQIDALMKLIEQNLPENIIKQMAPMVQEWKDSMKNNQPERSEGLLNNIKNFVTSNGVMASLASKTSDAMTILSTLGWWPK